MMKKKRSKSSVKRKRGSTESSLGGTTLPTQKTKRGVEFKDYIHLFFGPPGVGKTTFVNGLDDNILFLSTDRGTRFLEAMAVECNEWSDFEDVLKQLKAAKKKKSMPYSAVCIDHVADWASQGETAVLEKLNIEALTDAGYGKGWSVYKKLLERYIQELRALDLGIIFIAHEDIKTVKERGLDIDKVMPKMSKQAWDLIIPLCDLVGYCGMRRVKTKGKDGKTRAKQIRTITTSPPRDELYVKDRTDREQPSGKDYMELDGEAFVATFQ